MTKSTKDGLKAVSIELAPQKLHIESPNLPYSQQMREYLAVSYYPANDLNIPFDQPLLLHEKIMNL